jgi:acetylornithine deacetylase
MPDAPIIDRLDRWLEEHRCLAQEGLRHLVQVPSVTGDEGGAQRQFVRQLAELGLPASLERIDRAALAAMPGYLPGDSDYAERPNVRATLHGVGGGRALLFVGHIDVVADGAGWRRGAWAGEIEGDLVFGRGTADAKGGLWAAALALAALRAVGAPLRGDVGVASAVEEETTGNGALDLCRQGIGADGVVVLEPTAFDVCYGHQGVVGLRVDVPGVAGHGAQRSGANAVVRGAEVVHSLDRLQRGWNAPMRAGYPVPVINIARMCGGDDLFTVPSSCRIDATVRFPPGHGDAVRAEVCRAASHSWDGPAGCAMAGVSVPFLVEAAHTPVDSPFLQLLLQAAQTVQPNSAMGPFPATCDARHFTGRGLPVGIFGPGSLARAHGPDEWIGITEVLDAARILARLALAWCG